MKNIVNFINEQMITEHFVNVFNKSDMEKYADEVWEVLLKAYSYMPDGLVGMNNVQQLIDETDMWKLVRKNGKIVAVNTYSNKRGGRKMCYGGCDGSEEGKAGFIKMLEEDFSLLHRESWAEVSGRMQTTALRHNAMPIPAEIANEIMSDKEFLEMLPDGYHYNRKIAGKPFTKIMVGNYGGKRYEALPEIIQELIEIGKSIGKSE